MTFILPIRSHRETYPEQYSHNLVGRVVRVKSTGKTFEVERVVNCKFGCLVHVKDDPKETAYSIFAIEVA